LIAAAAVNRLLLLIGEETNRNMTRQVFSLLYAKQTQCMTRLTCSNPLEYQTKLHTVYSENAPPLDP